MIALEKQNSGRRGFIYILYNSTKMESLGVK